MSSPSSPISNQDNRELDPISNFFGEDALLAPATRQQLPTGVLCVLTVLSFGALVLAAWSSFSH